MKLFEFDQHIGDWRVLVQTRDINDGAIKSRHIAPEAITGDKIEHDSVIPGKIADDAVHTRNIKDRNVTSSKMADDSIETRSIKDQNVTNEKMKDNDLSWEKLDDNLKQLVVTGGGQHGIPLSKEFGDSDMMGVTQKTLTESRDDLQNQINAIVNDKAEVSLAASPSLVFVGVQSNISLVATTNTQATSIKIKKGTTEIATGSGLTLNGSDTIMPSAAGNTTYLAEFTIAGLLKQTTKNVVAVYPILYGAGDEYTEAQTQASVRTTPAGTYNVVVPENEDYVFFVVPRNMNINSAKMSGFDFPLQAPVNVEIEGVEYKYYQSANTYDAGTLTIVIS